MPNSFYTTSQSIVQVDSDLHNARHALPLLHDVSGHQDYFFAK
jgi:hypothetical protein